MRRNSTELLSSQDTLKRCIHLKTSNLVAGYTSLDFTRFLNACKTASLWKNLGSWAPGKLRKTTKAGLPEPRSLAMVKTSWRTTKPRKTRVKNNQLVSPTGWNGETNRCVQDYFVSFSRYSLFATQTRRNIFVMGHLFSIFLAWEDIIESTSMCKNHKQSRYMHLHWWRCHPAQPTARINGAAEAKLDRSHELVRMVNRKFDYDNLLTISQQPIRDSEGVHSFGSGENSGSTLMTHLSLNQNKRLKNWQNTSQCHWGHCVWCRSLSSYYFGITAP